MVDQLYRDDAELALLGSALLSPSIVRECGVKPEHFHNLERAKIWRAMLALSEAGEAIDPVTVAAKAEIRLTDVIPLMSEIGTPAGGPAYANIIKDFARRRTMVECASEIARLAYAGGEIGTGMAQAYKRLEDVWDTSAMIDGALIASALFDKLSGSSPQAPPMETPWLELDASIGYVQPGEAAIIAARPSMGKTQMLVQIASHALDQGKRIVIHSLETSEQGIVQRMALLRSEVNSMALRLGGLSQADLGPYSQELAKLMGMTDRLYVVHGRQSADDVCYAIRSLERTTGHIDLVVVDYLQRYKTAGESRVRELGDVLDRFKDLAIDIRAVIWIASQLNRSTEDREDKRPTMADMRESGEIEQTADVILGLYRDNYYRLGGDGSGPTEVIPLKVRDGARGGTVTLEWNAKKVRFERSVAGRTNQQILAARGLVRRELEGAQAGKGVQVPSQQALPVRQGVAKVQGGSGAGGTRPPAVEQVQERRGEVQPGNTGGVEGVQGSVLHDTEEGRKGGERTVLDRWFPREFDVEKDYIED